MLKLFYELDEMDSIEKNLLAEASNRLDVGEFQLFQLSYADWFGDEVDPKALEEVFFTYLSENRFPPWARHYARRIIAMDDRGELEFNDPKYHRFDARSMRPRYSKKGASLVVLIVLAAGLFLGASAFLLHDPTPKLDFPCNFPPCPWVP